MYKKIKEILKLFLLKISKIKENILEHSKENIEENIKEVS